MPKNVSVFAELVKINFNRFLGKIQKLDFLWRISHSTEKFTENKSNQVINLMCEVNYIQLMTLHDEN